MSEKEEKKETIEVTASTEKKHEDELLDQFFNKKKAKVSYCEVDNKNVAEYEIKKEFEKYTYYKKLCREHALQVASALSSVLLPYFDPSKLPSPADVLHVYNKPYLRAYVKDYKDFNAYGLVRILLLINDEMFPEFAIYTTFDMLKIIKDAFKGFNVEMEEHKISIRTNRFNLFLYGLPYKPKTIKLTEIGKLSEGEEDE
ncbi:MAG: hypothetical protein QW575_06350 [Thermoproteota archaeon]